MFGSSILEIAIGVIFIYLLLSLICSAVNEFIASIINKRGENLFEGIKNLLNDPTFTGLAQKLYNHGLVDGISQASQDPNKPNRHPSYMASKTFALALLDILGSQSAGESWKDLAEQRKIDLVVAKTKLDTNPKDTEFLKIFDDAQSALEQAQEILTSVDAVRQAYEEAECAAGKVGNPKDIKNLKTAKDKFERALTMGRLLAAELPDQLDNVQRAVSVLPDGHTKQSLFVLINNTKQASVLLNQTSNAAYEMEKLQENIEQWFNDAMDRVGGWYKRWTQKIILGIAVIIVLGGNFDTFMYVEKLGRDNALRASLIAVAENAVRDGSTAENAAREKLLREVDQLPLPIGWVPKKDDQFKTEQVPNCMDVPLSECLVNWGIKLAGLFISVIAIQLGAPFWFDTLSKFINIRSAGTPPGESAKSGPQPTKS
jgi:hypothetical protein